MTLLLICIQLQMNSLHRLPFLIYNNFSNIFPRVLRSLSGVFSDRLTHESFIKTPKASNQNTTPFLRGTVTCGKVLASQEQVFAQSQF
jgi:hypothetical protein